MFKKIHLFIFFLGVCISHSNAQVQLIDDGNWHTIEYSGDLQDIQVPADPNYGYIEFKLVGGDGGHSESDWKFAEGGQGTEVQFTLELGNTSPNLLPFNSTLRFIVGEKGENCGYSDGGGGGGGGGTALLNTAGWKLLGVAGGGGGGLTRDKFTANSSIERDGKDGSVFTWGTKANPAGYAAGTDGNGGEHSPREGYGGGGGGAYTDAYSSDGSGLYSHSGRAGLTQGGVGGDGGPDTDRGVNNGGFGFGSGGAGWDQTSESYSFVSGGGGGGGYSGGAGGNMDRPGGSGGSFVQDGPYRSTIIVPDSTIEENGRIEYRFLTPQDCGPQIVSLDVINPADCSNQNSVTVDVGNINGCTANYQVMVEVIREGNSWYDIRFAEYDDPSVTISNLPAGTFQVSVKNLINNTYIVTDTTHFTITHLDTEDPMANFHSPTIYLDTDGEAVLTVAEVDNGSTDDCGIAAIGWQTVGNDTVLSPETTYGCNDLGTRLQSIFIQDYSGAFIFYSFELTVIDNIPPHTYEINLPDEFTYNLLLPNSGSITLDQAYFDAEITSHYIDNCTDNVFINSDAIGATISCTDVGSTLSFSATVSDNQGNETNPFTININVQPSETIIVNYNSEINASLSTTNGETIITTDDIINSVSGGCLTLTQIKTAYDWPAGGVTYTCADVGTHAYTINPITNTAALEILTINVQVEDPTPISNVQVQDTTVTLDDEGLGYLSLDDLVFSADVDNCYTLAEIKANYSIPPAYTVFSCIDIGTVHTIPLHSEDENFPTVTAAISVLYTGSPPCEIDPSTLFITTWETTSPNETITIPTTGDNYLYTVNWGDGMETNGHTADATHEYATSGIYTVTIAGDFPRIFFNNTGDRNKIRSVQQWGKNPWTSMESAFYGCENFDVTATDVPNLSNVKSLKNIFRDCYTMVGTPDFNDWDVSNITTMRFVFGACRVFNQDVSSWNVSNVTDMWATFAGCWEFNQDISSWNVGNVQQAGYMFANARKFNQDIGNWDVSNLAGAFQMFNNAHDFDQDLGKWDVSNLNNATAMFNNMAFSETNYDKLLIGWSTLDAGETQIPTNLVFDAQLSKYCVGEVAREILETTYGWTITDAGINCSENPFITQWKVGYISESGIEFTKTIIIPTTGSNYDFFVDWGDATTIERFTGTEEPTHTYAIAGEYEVKIYGDFPRIHFSSTTLAFADKLKLVGVTQWGDIQWTSMEGAFKGCGYLDVTATDTPNLSHVTTMENMFSTCGRLTGTEAFNNWDVSTITNMADLFNGASIFNQNINNWNVSNVTNMKGMFVTTRYNQDISSWNVGKVEDMSYMFFFNDFFNQDISGWDVSDVIDMNGMFRGTTSFDQDIGDWDISNVTDMANMFGLVELSLENYDALLIGWSTLDTDTGETQIPINVTFGGGNSQYCLSEIKREELIALGWVITDAGRECPQTVVPDVVGLSQTEAETTLTNAGLSLEISAEVYSITVAAGDVISQSPGANTSVELGSDIDVVISLGKYPLIITGIVANNPQSLHVIELYVTRDVADLSNYAISVDNQNDGSDGPEFYLSGAAAAGDFIYIAQYPDKFQEFFGFAPNFDLGGSNNTSPFGNNAVELFYDDTNTNTPLLLDSYGNVGENGNSTAWEYNRSWVYRKTGTGPDGGFEINNWRIPGPDILEGSDLTNTNVPVPFPTGTYGLPYDDIAPTAVCQNINFEVNQGNTMVDPSLVDNGSSDNIGIAFMKLDDSVYNCSEAGTNPVTLTVYDAAGNKDTCTATINVTLAASQVICQDLAVSLDFNGEATVSFHDIATGFEGACVAEGSQFYLTTTDPENGLGGGIFNGETTASSTTDDVFDDGNAQYYESFSFTVPEDGNYLPEFNFNSANTNDLLFAFISDQPVTPNTGDVTSRAGFLNGFVYAAPSFYVGSFNNDDDVFLSSNTTYYLQVVVINQDDGSSSTAIFSGSFGEEELEFGEDEYTYTIADIGDNIIYAVIIDDIGRMSYCTSTVTVTSLDPFITTWKTDNPGTSDDHTIMIPTTGTGYNYQVDWGDGAIQNFIGENSPTHTYATPGTYTVSITGNFPRIYFNNSGDKNKLLTVEQWGNIEWSSMENAFYGCSNLNIINPSIDIPNLSNVTSLAGMFKFCYAFNGTISNWDVSSVTNMSSMFEEAEIFNTNINTWNVGEVTNMDNMFTFASAFNQDLNNWNTENVTTLASMFSYANNFNGNISNWDVSNVTNMSSMFEDVSNFNQNISNWNVANVTNMSNMFNGVVNFNQHIGNWNVAKVTDMSGMFGACSNFNQDISAWNVGEVTNMSFMFNQATSFNQDISNWDVSKVTNMASMFRDATGFDQNLGNWHIGNIVDAGPATGLRDMFKNIGLSLENYDDTLIGWRSITTLFGLNATPANIVFDGGSSNYCIADSSRQWLLNNKGWTITDGELQCNFDDVFIIRVNTENPGVTENNQFQLRAFGNTVIDWGDGTVSSHANVPTHTYATPGLYTIRVLGDFYMNHYDTEGEDPTDALKLLEVQQWGDTKWPRMGAAFIGCTNLQITATDTPDLSECTGLNFAFAGCSSLGDTDAFNNWDVSTITDISKMFQWSSFNGDISSWNVSKVLNMDGVFQNNTNFDQDLGDWDLSSVVEMSSIFKNATLSIENYDNILIGWATDSSGVPGDDIDDVPYNANFGQTNSMYCAGANAREELLTTYSWIIDDDGQADDCANVLVSPKVFLQGATLNPNTGEENLMRDDLRVAGLIPTTTPYTDTKTLDVIVLNTTGSDAIVDWVWVELRDATDSDIVIDGQSALLQRDGDVVAIDGVSPLSFTSPQDIYNIAITHRNHLGILTATPLSLTSAITAIDFSLDATTVSGNTLSLKDMGNGIYAMYGGDVNTDGRILNTDINNAISNSGSINVYSGADVNMDGNVLNADIALIIQPNAGRIQQF